MFRFAVILVLMNKKYRILTLTSWYPNDVDPQQGVFIEEQLNTIKKQHHITHILVRPGKQNQVVEENFGQLKRILFIYQTSNDFLKPIKWLLTWRKAYRFIKNENFDLLHLHVIYPLGFIALRLKKHFRIPLLVTEHWSGYGNKKDYSGYFRKTITEAIFRKAKAVIVQSKFLQKSIESQNLINNFFLVPNIVRFAKPSEQIKTQTEIVKVLNVADHIDSTKNISGLLRACKICLEENNKLKFEQIGDGEDSVQLKKLANSLNLKEKFEWKGRLLNPEVLTEIQNCDFGVINSNIETFSIVAFEFLAAGKPIVITHCGGPEEYLPKNFGIFTSKNNDSELANSILKMAQEYKSFSSKEISKTVIENFSEEKFLSRINKVYQEILS